MEDIFSRTALLIGNDGLNKLSKARVAVFGVGGVGSYVIEGLCRAGVGNFILIDDDLIHASNFNRQLPAVKENLGLPKVEVLLKRIKSICPKTTVKIYQERYKAGDGDKFLRDDLDYVVDAIDDIKAKVDLLEYCVRNKISVVSSMGAGNKMDPTAFKIADISKTSVCPLAKQVRKLLRQKGIEKGISVVYSEEKPILIPKSEDGSKIIGSISFVPSVAGLILAGFIVKELLKNKKL